MASKRRAAGELDALILTLLESEDRPLTGLMLAEMLRKQGEAVAISLVFRALCKLVERGVVHKLLTSRGYLLARSPNELYLTCTACGAVERVVREEPFRRIETAAARFGFRVTRPIVEMAGRCPRCRSARSEDAS